jgi:hypothetical protein
MKKLLIAMLILASTGAMAQHRHQGGYRGNWITPAIIGGVIGYGLTRNYYEPYYVPALVIVQQQPVIVQTPYYNQTPNCTVWTEVQDQDGTITRTRTCRQ